MLEDRSYAHMEFRPFRKVDRADTIGVHHIIVLGKHGTHVVHVGGFIPRINCGSCVERGTGTYP